MDIISFKFVCADLNDDEKKALAPVRHSSFASGFDLASANREEVVLSAKSRILISTGIAIALEPGYEGQVRSRSGLALKSGIIVLNSPGTIDADYRGEIKVLLANLSDEPFRITFGMRIAQLVIQRVWMPAMMEVLELDHSSRGEGGFGSTGT
jgi:dUTP pyrophosphatase